MNEVREYTFPELFFKYHVRLTNAERMFFETLSFDQKVYYFLIKVKEVN